MKKRILALIIVLSMIMTIIPVQADHYEPMAREFKFERISGKNRYETAIKIAEEIPAEKQKEVVLVDGNGYADALTGGLLAIQSNAIILLANKNNLPKETKDYIINNDISKVTILGGENSVSAKAEADIKALGITTKRIAGTNRFETSNKVYEEISKLFGLESLPVGKYGLVDGYSYADALAATPYMASSKDELKGALLLYHTGMLQDSSGLVFGGPDRVPDFPNILKRFSGSDRYKTAAAIADMYGKDNGKWTGYEPKEIFIASGHDYPDALAAAPLINARQGVLLLSKKHTLDDSTINYIYYSNIDKITIIGGENSVQDVIIEQIKHMKISSLKQYTNSRFGFRLIYPDSLINNIVESENGDGITMYAEHFTVRAYAGYNIMEYDLRKELEINERYKDMIITEDIIDGYSGYDLLKSTATGFHHIKTVLVDDTIYTIEVESRIPFGSYSVVEQLQIELLMKGLRIK